MKTLPFSICIVLLLNACNTNKADYESNSVSTDTIPELVEKSHLPALMPGEVELPDDVFGDIIELTGTSHPVDQLFKVQETQLLAKENMLIIKNRNEDNYFMAFSLPDFQHIKSFGRRGKGPGEFAGPSIIQTSQPEHLFSMFNAM